MKLLKGILFILLFYTLASCTAHKNIPYLQNHYMIDSIQQIPVLYDARIMPKDLLTIVVSCSEPELAVPYNLTAPTSVITAQSRSTTTQPSLQSYLVDNEGYIEFPSLGLIKVGGLTKGETENMISEKLRAYIDDPIVNVRLMNYKISVIGEVNKPGMFTVANEKVNVLEALALAGDLTIYGLRENILLVREEADGKQKSIVLNLNDVHLVFSPYYYLQQNDVLIVTPNKTKARNAGISTSTTIWISITTTLVSIASLLVTILR